MLITHDDYYLGNYSNVYSYLAVTYRDLSMLDLSYNRETEKRGKRVTLEDAVKIIYAEYVGEEGERSLIEVMLITFKTLTAREVNSWGADADNVDAYELLFNSELSDVATAIESVIKEN